MSERDKFEQWLAELLEFDAEDLKRRRYTDDDGVDGYIGLAHEGHSEDADDLASIAIQAWQSARAQQAGSGEAVAVIAHTSDPRGDDPKAFVKWLFGGDETNLPNGTELFTHPQPAQQGSVPEFDYDHPTYCEIIEKITEATHRLLLAAGHDAETALDMDEAIEANIYKNIDLVALELEGVQQGSVPESVTALVREAEDACQDRETLAESRLAQRWLNSLNAAINTLSDATPRPEGEGCKACGGTGFRSAGADKIGTWPCEFCKRPNPPAEGAE